MRNYIVGFVCGLVSGLLIGGYWWWKLIMSVVGVFGNMFGRGSADAAPIDSLLDSVTVMFNIWFGGYWEFSEGLGILVMSSIIGAVLYALGKFLSDD